MNLKIQVGLSRKIGQPHFGSLGASCSVELAIDRRLRRAGGESLQRQIAEVFRVCEQAVEAELAKSTQQVPQPPLRRPAGQAAVSALARSTTVEETAAGQTGTLRAAAPPSTRAAALPPTRPGSASVARDLPGMAGPPEVPQSVPQPRPPLATGAPQTTVAPSATGSPPTTGSPPAIGTPATTGTRVAAAQRPATIPQIKALQAIASQAGVALGAETSRRFGVPAARYLTVQQASRLIDELKALLSAAASKA
jgi:hypothetical protein